MSLYSPMNGASRELFPGIEVLQLERDLSIEELQEFASTLVIPKHVDISCNVIDAKLAEPLGQCVEMRRSPDSPREPWAPDHHWHTDRVYWGENQFATILYAKQLAGDVAGIEFIDTTLLLDAIEQDQPGITKVLKPATTIFSVVKYYAKVLPAKGTKEAIERTLEQKDCADLEELVAREAMQYPPKQFPTVSMHPFRAKGCLMLDEARAIDIENSGLSCTEVQAIIAKIIRNYLALPSEELAERFYYAHHEWEEGQVVIMPQLGAIHRAQASPLGELKRNTLRSFIK
jgi:alpha-ketoglutarate-dependent taurine dioxygenase